jgi:hypothetical protein
MLCDENFDLALYHVYCTVYAAENTVNIKFSSNACHTVVLNPDPDKHSSFESHTDLYVGDLIWFLAF